MQTNNYIALMVNLTPISDSEGCVGDHGKTASAVVVHGGLLDGLQGVGFVLPLAERSSCNE